VGGADYGAPFAALNRNKRSVCLDLNYLALSGILNYGGEPSGKPYPPPTVMGDVGGGGLVLALGIVAAVLRARENGEGQVIDSAIVDGAAYMGMLLASKSAGGGGRVANGGAPWSNSYRCADGRYITVQSLEPRFYGLLMELCGFAGDPDFEGQNDHDSWPDAHAKMERLFLTRSRDEWCAVLEGTDACFAPVLTPEEAHRHPHGEARGLYLEDEGRLQPAPAPRFDRTPSEVGEIPVTGQHTVEILRRAGLGASQVNALKASGALVSLSPAN